MTIKGIGGQELKETAMVQLTLTPEEAATLREVLTIYLSDLRMEIADTNHRDFREGLKKQEAVLNALLQRLPAEENPPE
ncbi:MAG: hypothetical protein D6736_05240 [Nitrospinota bacterium]|nr:MAG: hypothetical protein D6736_05240 [Nitrospinota bacterium]